MAFHCLDSPAPSKPPVAVHDEGDMSWDRTLPQRSEEQFPDLIESPFGGGRRHKPFSEPRSHHRMFEARESRHPEQKEMLTQEDDEAPSATNRPTQTWGYVWPCRPIVLYNVPWACRNVRNDRLAHIDRQYA